MLMEKSLNTSLRSSRGFSMVELAIVILIISTLLGAILGAREVVRTVRLKKIGAEVQGFGVAARAFEQKYEALPGDFDAADEVIAGCRVNGDGTPNNPNFCRNGDGNGIIGSNCHFADGGCQRGQTGALSVGNEKMETSLFWKHLLLSGYITGIVEARANPANPRWRETHPESAVWDSGYVISAQDGFIGGSVVVHFIPFPEYLSSAAQQPSNKGDERSLTLNDAHYIDDKFDNGGPGSGAIWWDPVANDVNDPSGCRYNDSGAQNTWETRFPDERNCVFSWTVF